MTKTRTPYKEQKDLFLTFLECLPVVVGVGAVVCDIIDIVSDGVAAGVVVSKGADVVVTSPAAVVVTSPAAVVVIIPAVVVAAGVLGTIVVVSTGTVAVVVSINNIYFCCNIHININVSKCVSVEKVT